MSPLPPDFEQRLSSYRAPAASRPAPSRRAAVAAVLRESAGGPEVLLMRRAEQAGDPWSGHVSLPGGNVDPDDRDLLHTAVRETREEVSVDLERDARLLCRLASLEAVGRRLGFEMDITPFVFRLATEVAPRPGPEAQSVFWLPLVPAIRGDFDGETRWRQGDVTRVLPCWHYQGHMVWGLTHRMLGALLEAGGVSRTGT